METAIVAWSSMRGKHVFNVKLKIKPLFWFYVGIEIFKTMSCDEYFKIITEDLKDDDI